MSSIQRSSKQGANKDGSNNDPNENKKSWKNGGKSDVQNLKERNEKSAGDCKAKI